MNDASCWAELRRFDDPVAAEVALNFLRDHGVAAELRGNRSATASLERLAGGGGLRIVVHDADLGRARETLAAMFAPDDAAEDAAPGRPPESALEGDAGGPYRGALVVGAAPGVPARPRRYLSGAIVLAAVFPGAAHFYARHDRAGLVICTAVVSCAAAGLATGASWLVLGALCCMAADALLGLRAVRRHNADRVPSDARQTLGAGVAVGLCLLVGFVLRGGRAGHRGGAASCAAPAR